MDKLGRIANSIIIIMLLSSAAFSIVGTNTGSASPPQNGIVAIGDSITEGAAAAPNTYPAQLSRLLNITVKNMGIGGQTTTQMLARFDTDVVAKNPGSVIIEGGINDIAKGVAVAKTESNIDSMVAIADAAGIRVYLCTITPVNRFNSAQNLLLHNLNIWINAKTGVTIVDTSALKGPDGRLIAAYDSGDGVHLNPEGCRIFARAVTAVYPAPAIPEIPTGLTITAGNTAASLNWAAPVNDGGSRITEFRIFRSTTETGALSMIASTIDLSYIDTELENGQTYGYCVSAVNEVGMGDRTALITSTPCTVPSAPMNLTVITGNTQVVLNWTVPTDDGGSAIDHYVIYQEGVDVAHVTSNSTIITDLTNGQAYSFVVRAHNKIGNGANSTAVTSVPFNPVVVTFISPANNTYCNTSSVAIMWAVSDVLSSINKIEISTDRTTWTPVIGTSGTLSLSDASYMIYVRATDNIGNVNETSMALTVDATAPSITIISPGVSSYNTTGIVTVRWNAIDAFSIFKTEISIDDATWTTVTGTSYSTSSMGDGPHRVYVKATDNAGNENTTSVSFTIDTVKPTITSVSPNGDNVSPNATIVVMFSEAMNGTSTTITVEDVTGTLAWRGNVAIFTPSALAHNGEYNVTVVGYDLPGNAVTKTWTFNTTKVGNIAGYLVDADNVTIANATVTLSNGMTTTSDEYGCFVFRNVTVGSYNLTVVLADLDSTLFNVIVEANATSDLGRVALSASDSGTPSSSGCTELIAIIIVALAVIGGMFYMGRRPKTPY